jgi:hypothetical protein
MVEPSTGTATGELRGEESRVKKSGNFVDKRRTCRGLYLHPTLALTPERVPLGLLDLWS